MARRSGLGKGLGALIPTEVMGDRSSALLDIPVAAIHPNQHQPRTAFDEEGLASLTASIREVGILQPVLVREVEEGRYELIAGERRLRAAKRAGLQVIPAIVKSVTDVGRVEQALIENLHRQDLNPLEEAGAYQQLIEDFGLTHEQLSARVGKSRAAITNTLRLFQLPPAVQKLVSDGQLSAGHARALLGTPDRGFQEALARRAVAEQLSVRAVEDAVKERNSLGGAATQERTARHSKLRPPGILELEELLSSHLDTRVKVELGNKRGKVTIDFASLEDLERIYRAMTEPPTG
ncbi:MAG TPA: ParB/RepB/Spo0J family partition protein [Acidimicrobiales bacterium]|nr:ParB/RepB/Spo0J family partition protein [Acidimicrobiales bacterium]